MNRRQALETIILAGIGTSLTGCNLLKSDEQQIEDIAINLNESLKEGDVESFMSSFSEDYILYSQDRNSLNYYKTKAYLEEALNSGRCSIDLIWTPENNNKELQIVTYNNIALMAKPFKLTLMGYEPFFGDVFVLKKDLLNWKIMYSTDYFRVGDEESTYKFIDEVENHPRIKEVRSKR